MPWIWLVTGPNLVATVGSFCKMHRTSELHNQNRLQTSCSATCNRRVFTGPFRPISTVLRYPHKST